MFHPISRTDRAGIGLKCGVFHISASQIIINSLEKPSKFQLVTKLCGNLAAFIGYSSFIFIGVSRISIIENRVSIKWVVGGGGGGRHLGYLPLTTENRKFQVENQIVRAIPFWKIQKVSAVIYGNAIFLHL